MLVAYYASFQDELTVKLRLTNENPLFGYAEGDKGVDSVDSPIPEGLSPAEAIAAIDAVLPVDSDYEKFDSCDIILQELNSQ